MSVSPHPSQRLRRTSILRRAVRHSLLLTCMIVVTLSATAFVVARALLEQRVLSQVSLAASAGEDFLQEAMRVARERASLIASLEQVRDILISDVPEQTLSRWGQALHDTQYGLIGVGIFDLDGLLRAGTGSIGGTGIHDVTATEVIPAIEPEGWRWYEVMAPVHDTDGGYLGTVALRYDAAGFLPSFETALSSLGDSSEVYLAVPMSGDITVLRRDRVVGDLPQWRRTTLPVPMHDLLRRSVNGEEGVASVDSGNGRAVLVAYRNIPSLGWTIAVQVHESEALAGVRQLGVTLLAIGVLLFLLAVLLGLLLARQLTTPLRTLTGKVEGLQPGNWGFAKTVKTGDEVELLDTVIASMAERLRQTYEYLEEEVRARTAQLKEQFALDRAILEGVDYGVMTVDPQSNVSSVNPAAARILGVEPGALIGKAASEALPLCTGRECTPVPEHYVDRCLRGRSVERPDARAHISIARPSGSLPIDLLVSPLLEEGRLLGAVVMFQDVSEERRIDEMKSEFISLASHQLRTPISILNWYMELLGGDPKALQEEQREYLREMRIAASRMSGLLNALLQVARLEGGSVAVSTGDVDVQAMISEVMEDANGMAEPKKITCTSQVPKSSLVLQTDGALLKVVLQNLVTNAVKYGKKNGTLSLKAEQTDGIVRFTVSDDGVGIPMVEQAHIFEKFFRAKNVKQFDTDGNGLGLYMNKMIIDGLGGTISFTSGEGKGTTFVVDIPIAVQKSSTKAAEATVAASSGKQPVKKLKTKTKKPAAKRRKKTK